MRLLLLTPIQNLLGDSRTALLPASHFSVYERLHPCHSLTERTIAVEHEVQKTAEELQNLHVDGPLRTTGSVDCWEDAPTPLSVLEGTHRTDERHSETRGCDFTLRIEAKFVLDYRRHERRRSQTRLVRRSKVRLIGGLTAFTAAFSTLHRAELQLVEEVSSCEGSHQIHRHGVPLKQEVTGVMGSYRK